MIKNTAFILLFILSLNLYAQKCPIKFKKLTKEEIELTEYNGYSAVITYDYGQMFFDTNPNGENLFIFNKRHVRIKILSEEGLKYSKVTFLYHDMNCEKYSGELSYSLKAYTHNISEDGKIKTTRLKHKNIKHKDSTNCLVKAEFEFLDVKVGSILEYEINIPSLNLIKPETWYFQKELPVIYSEFRARIPDDFTYAFFVKNIKDLYKQDSSYYDYVINYNFEYNRRKYSTVLNLSGKQYIFVNKYMSPIRNKADAEKINIHVKRISAGDTSFPWRKLTRALMITTNYSYYSRTPSQRRLIQYPSAYIIYYLKTWEELNKSLLFDENFGLAIIKHWNCDSLFNSIIKNKNSDTEKAIAIYNFVKKKMFWNNKYSVFADVSDNLLKKIYSKSGGKVKLNNIGTYFNEGKGTSSEINFVLMYLLNKANIKVYPVLANTTDNDVLDKDIPVINQFTTTIAMIELNDKKILLDAAFPDSKFNNISQKLDKKQMFIVRKENFGWFIE